MVQKKTLAEKLGPYGPRIIELFLQNEAHGEPSLADIPALVPEAELTLGRLVGIRRDHPEEIAAQKRAYLLEFGDVPAPGESKLGNIEPGRLALAQNAARFSENDLPPLREGDRYAHVRRREAMNVVRGDGQIRDGTLRRVAERIGIVRFLESEGIPHDLSELAAQNYVYRTR